MNNDHFHNIYLLFNKSLQLKQNLSILIYHRVLNNYDFLSPDEFDKKKFISHLEILNKFFNVVSLQKGLELLKNNTLPFNSVAITFDDGYADNYFNAYPLLKKFNMTATFFIATGYLNGKTMWNDLISNAIRETNKEYINLSKLGYENFLLTNKKEAFEKIIKLVKYEPYEKREKIAQHISEICDVAYPQGLMMNESHVAEMASHGMEIGGHTVNHPILCELDDKAANFEINQCKRDIEAIINKKVTVFAYPNGKPDKDYSLRHIKFIKQAGYTYACSTAWGTAKRNTDLFQLPRFTPWDFKQTKFLLQMTKNYFRSPLTTTLS